MSNTMERTESSESVAVIPPQNNDEHMQNNKQFWSDRLIEIGLVTAMTLFYLIGNKNIKLPIGDLSQINPLFAWPFLAAFVVLSWHRLPFALALLPLSLPFYLAPKVVWGSSVRFSPAEITLWVLFGVAVAQWVWQRGKWQYGLSFAEFRQRVGPFMWPALLFFAVALISISVALSRGAAIRTFRQEVVGPLLYVCLLLFCLRTKQDVTRLLSALFGAGLFVALIGVVQYFSFMSVPTAKASALPAIRALYGNQNSVGMFFDYTLPIGLALVLARVNWQLRVAIAVLCVPFFFVLFQSQSRGAALAAFPVVALFLIISAIRNKKVLLFGGLTACVLAAVVLGVFQQKISQYVDENIINGHTNARNVSTAQKRLYLWQSAKEMISDSPWIGYGLDNWLCHYSDPAKSFHYKAKPPWAMACQKAPEYYRIDHDNGRQTYMNEEPDLSHPHNIFLHIWVSIGLFGLVAFMTLLIYFFWLFLRLSRYLAQQDRPDKEQWRWLLVAVGAAMVAAMVQGMVDSAFLEQDLAFCFWLLVAALLIIRNQLGMPWDLLWFKKAVA